MPAVAVVPAVARNGTPKGVPIGVILLSSAAWFGAVNADTAKDVRDELPPPTRLEQMNPATGLPNPDVGIPPTAPDARVEDGVRGIGNKLEDRPEDDRL